MRTRPHACRTAELVHAQIALGCLQDRRLCLLVHDKLSLLVANLHHLNVVIRATVCAGCASNAGEIVDHDLALERFPMNCACGTPDHANRIDTMHTGICHHDPVELPTVTDEFRIIIVARSARAYAIITARTTIEVDQHRGSAVDVALLNQKLDHVRTELRFGLLFDVDLSLLTDSLAHLGDFAFLEMRSDDLLNNGRRNDEDIYITDRPQRKLEAERTLTISVTKQFFQAKNFAFAQISERALAVIIFSAQSGKTAANQNKPVW